MKRCLDCGDPTDEKELVYHYGLCKKCYNYRVLEAKLEVLRDEELLMDQSD